MVLVGMAVTAVSGCVAVEPLSTVGPTPRTETTSDRHDPGSGPSAAGEVSPPIAQSPAREALEAVTSAPGDTAAPAGTPASRASAAAPPGPPGRLSPGMPWATGHPPRERSAPRWPTAYPPLPTTSGSGSVPVTGGLCALGTTFGGWPEDSPQARACRTVQGHGLGH